MRKKIFRFWSEDVANGVQVGDILTTTSSHFPYCATGFFREETKTTRVFCVKRRKDLDLIAQDQTRITDSGDYNYYRYEVLNVCPDEPE